MGTAWRTTLSLFLRRKKRGFIALTGIALGIAVLGKEGLSLAAMKHADLVVKGISDAIDLLLKPKRLIATLRE